MPIVLAMNHTGPDHRFLRRCSGSGPFLIYVLLPLLDLRFRPDGREPSRMRVISGWRMTPTYRRIIYLYLLFQYASVIIAGLPVHRLGPELAGLSART